MEKQVHIIPKKVEAGQKYDPRLNSLVLKKAESFNITIKEVEELKKQKPTAPKPITELSKEEYNKISETARWNYDVDVMQYNIDVKKYNEKIKVYNESLKKFEDLNWTWQLVNNGVDPNKITHYAAFEKGIHERISFPKLLEGGGIAWLEAWHEKEKPKGISPFGMYVQAEGVAQIVRAEWTDLRYNTINQGTTVAFGSKAILHIYTAGLYGQEVEVHLADSDIFTPNDKLKIAGEDFFTREVKVYKVKPNDINKKGVSGILTVDNDQVDYAQKIEIEVVLDNAWIKTAGANLQIYAVVKSIKTGTFFKEFSRSYIHVSDEKKSITPDQEPIPATNMPLIVGDVETNVAHFQHCRYTAIELEYEKGEKTETVEIFKEKPGILYNPNVEIGLIVGSVPKKFSIKVDEKSDTDECRFHEKPNDHGKNIFTFDKAKLPKNISITKHEPKSIEGTAFFEFDLADLPKYFWLSDDNSKAISKVPITAATCRHQHNILLKVVPEIEWTINFLYNTQDPVWYGQSSPTYDIYGTEKTAVRDNTSIGDIRGAQNRVALADLKREENLNNANARDGKKKIATTANRHFGDAKSNFGLSVKAVYDNGKSQELSFKFAENYRKTLSALKSIYDLVDKIAGAKEAREASESLPPSLLGRRNMMSLSLLPPAPSVGVSWKYNNIDNRLGIELAGKAKIAPLIGGDLKIDVLALADKIPLFGKLVTALDLTTWLVEKIAMNTLSINYRIDLTFYANLALEEAFVKYNEAKEKGKRLDADLKISGTLGGKLELEMGVKLSLTQITAKPKIEFEAGIKGDCYFKITASPNANYDNIIDWTTKFSGLIVTVYYKVKVTSQKDNKVPKKLNPFELIPSYSGTPISMKYGEGAENKF
ncbi:hypothetical protein SD960_08070 [Flavobacterium sp. MMLR14_040]|uniref:hypothetical protein n=1 Tax=Flavobacterium sp. MMLR14_040 TaxID=3093843 RepID=UPI00298F58E2|nr:hypothetical protein [Flavobacterium sp. MMLR14_040]MDW8850043.1 hypothetical protein [Flavobacterium sp. MMLR14_040]